MKATLPVSGFHPQSCHKLPDTLRDLVLFADSVQKVPFVIEYKYLETFPVEDIVSVVTGSDFYRGSQQTTICSFQGNHLNTVKKSCIDNAEGRRSACKILFSVLLPVLLFLHEANNMLTAKRRNIS